MSELRPAWPREGRKRGLVFGDVVRVDAKGLVPGPDNRRWMVIAFDDRLKWTMLFLSTEPGVMISHWPTLYGFELVE